MNGPWVCDQPFEPTNYEPKAISAMKYSILQTTCLIALFLGTLLLGCSEPEKAPDPSPENTIVADGGVTRPDSSVAQNGLQRITTKNGGHMEGMLLEGKRSGAWVAFFPDGTVQSKANYADGVDVGPTEVYHPNGNVYYSGPYTNGKPSGEWVFHGSDGAEMKRVVYDGNGAVVK